MSKTPESPLDLVELQRDTFGYFVHEANPANGLVPDNTRYGSPSSIAAVGFALSCYPVGVERGIMKRDEAVARTLTTLRFFHQSPQGPQPDATGYRGFYYHFLHMKTGQRAHRCELSTMDTAILLVGALVAAAYFDRPTRQEEEIRELADALYRRADWRWVLNGGTAVTHGWRPERGFLNHRWEGYNEALILYVLGLGSPTHPLPRQSYAAWTSTYRWKTLYGHEFLYSGPLFTHQLSHLWIDFRGIQDEFMHAKAIDYFENSRRATYVQQRYAIENPRRFTGYAEFSWGISASDGPGHAVRRVRGIRRRFYDYRARGVPFGPDDGTLSPWAVVGSLPFAPEIVVPTIRHFDETYPEVRSRYGFLCSFNPTFPGGTESQGGWVARGYYGLDQGPVVLMIENYRTGLIWRLMRQCPYLIAGLSRAGFSGGWLGPHTDRRLS
ncbi:MAG: glucoamylase family protein [Armatimonadota bacterium]